MVWHSKKKHKKEIKFKICKKIRCTLGVLKLWFLISQKRYYLPNWWGKIEPGHNLDVVEELPVGRLVDAVIVLETNALQHPLSLCKSFWAAMPDAWGAWYALGEKPNMHKICATLKMGSGWVPHISSSMQFRYKICWYFWSERSADHFKYPQGTFLIFSRKFWSFEGSKILETPKYSSEAYFFWWDFNERLWK